MTQDTRVLWWLASQLCDHHKKDRTGQGDCGFCLAYVKRLHDAYRYGKAGELPLELAEKILNGE